MRNHHVLNNGGIQNQTSIAVGPGMLTKLPIPSSLQDPSNQGGLRVASQCCCSIMQQSNDAKLPTCSHGWEGFCLCLFASSQKCAPSNDDAGSAVVAHHTILQVRIQMTCQHRIIGGGYWKGQHS